MRAQHGVKNPADIVIFYGPRSEYEKGADPNLMTDDMKRKRSVHANYMTNWPMRLACSSSVLTTRRQKHAIINIKINGRQPERSANNFVDLAAESQKI